ncbi:GyrI-like domain-containing protein [Lacrimispora xylanisolvens]|uniref:GyrI-like domain-containing protein n=1 Tax=Lacrimispora xylanisolvens TaxID=384636 RepID=UPI002402A742
MNYRIEEKEPFEVFGLELKTTVVNGQCYKDIPEFWMACGQDGRGQALLQTAGKKTGEVIDAGVTYDHNVNGDMSYMVGCIKMDQVVSPEYKTLSIPKQTWAIFQTEWKSENDDEKLHEVWGRIYSEWFPVASYEHADCDFDMEMYFGDLQSGYSAEIWIPVVQK